jgi:hypothetical protein
MPRKAVKGERRLASLNMKTTEVLRRHLEREAERSGRTLTHEVEYRLERSFSEDGTYTTATNAAILRDIASVFHIIGFDRKLGPNKRSRKLLMEVLERIVAAHLPDPPAGLRGLLGIQAEDTGEVDEEAFERLRQLCFRLTDAIIESSALPELPVVLASRPTPFGFHSDAASATGLLGLLHERPASLDKLQVKADEQTKE